MPLNSISITCTQRRVPCASSGHRRASTPRCESKVFQDLASDVRFGTGTCSSFPRIYLLSLSITNTSPLRLWPSTSESSPSFRHMAPTIMLKLSLFHRSFSNFLLTVLVSHKPHFSPTMNFPVVALNQVHAVLPHAQVRFPSARQHVFFRKRFFALQELICCLSVLRRPRTSTTRLPRARQTTAR